MKNIVLIQPSTGRRLTFPLEQIRNIRHGKAADYNTPAELRSENVRPDESILIVNLSNGESAYFAESWVICFE